VVAVSVMIQMTRLIGLGRLVEDSFCPTSDVTGLFDAEYEAFV
jgi:hypothetical protein